jgi:hypothetical protein
LVRLRKSYECVTGVCEPVSDCSLITSAGSPVSRADGNCSLRGSTCSVSLSWVRANLDRNAYGVVGTRSTSTSFLGNNLRLRYSVSGAHAGFRLSSRVGLISDDSLPVSPSLIVLVNQLTGHLYVCFVIWSVIVRRIPA